MSSRDDILGRVRAGLHRNATNAAAGREVMLAALSNRSHGPKPAISADPKALLERFQAKSELQSSTVDIVAQESSVPAAVARYLTSMNLSKSAVAWPSLTVLDWAAAGLSIEGRGARDADLVGMSPELRSTMLDAYTRVVDGVRRPLRTLVAVEEERMATIAGLLELGPRMGLHVSVAPALASTLVAGRTLGARTTVDPIDSSPPLRLRSDRDAYDAVDAVLYRRGRVLLFCEVVTGPLPIGELLLQRHALIASDREVVRLLVLAPALVPLLQLRLARDERLSAAWEAGNWHLLAADRVAALARLASPRLADLEGHLGAEPPARDAAQLDLGSMGWGVADSEVEEGVDREPLS